MIEKIMEALIFANNIIIVVADASPAVRGAVVGKHSSGDVRGINLLKPCVSMMSSSAQSVYCLLYYSLWLW